MNPCVCRSWNGLSGAVAGLGWRRLLLPARDEAQKRQNCKEDEKRCDDDPFHSISRFEGGLLRLESSPCQASLGLLFGCHSLSVHEPCTFGVNSGFLNYRLSW